MDIFTICATCYPDWLKSKVDENNFRLDDDGQATNEYGFVSLKKPKNLQKNTTGVANVHWVDCRQSKFSFIKFLTQVMDGNESMIVGFMENFLKPKDESNQDESSEATNESSQSKNASEEEIQDDEAENDIDTMVVGDSSPVAADEEASTATANELPSPNDDDTSGYDKTSQPKQGSGDYTVKATATPASSSEKTVITSSRTTRTAEKVNYKETGGRSQRTGKQKRSISAKAREKRRIAKTKQYTNMATLLGKDASDFLFPSRQFVEFKFNESAILQGLRENNPFAQRLYQEVFDSDIKVFDSDIKHKKKKMTKKQDQDEDYSTANNDDEDDEDLEDVDTDEE